MIDSRFTSRFSLRSVSEAVAYCNPDRPSSQYGYSLIGGLGGVVSAAGARQPDAIASSEITVPLYHTGPVRDAEVCELLARIVSKALLSSLPTRYRTFLIVA